MAATAAAMAAAAMAVAVLVVEETAAEEKAAAVRAAAATAAVMAPNDRHRHGHCRKQWAMRLQWSPMSSLCLRRTCRLSCRQPVA